MKLELRPDRSTLVLAATCAGLAVIVAAQLLIPQTPPDYTGPELADTGVARVTALPAYVPPDFDTFAEVLDRPLFFANRQLPPEPVQQAAPEAPRKPLRLTLEGVAMNSTSRVALVRDQRNNALVQIAEGMSHDGWTLEGVEPDQAIFRRSDEVTVLVLEVQSGNRQR